MSFVRPEVTQALSRWREVLSALTGAVVGLWLITLGGLFWLGLGAVVAAVSLALALLAWRRMRFRLEVDAPGVVEVDEGRISYLGPIMGGSVNLADLIQLDVLTVAGQRRCWRLHQSDGQSLLVPLAASGAERLYDHLAALPGMEAAILMSALDDGAATARTLWRRAPSASVPRLH